MSLPADDEFEVTEQADLEEGFADARATLSAMEEGQAPVEQEESARLRGEGEAADGQVQAVARAGGAVESVHIDPKAMRAGPEQLGVQVAAALNQALDQVREHADAVAGETGAAHLDQVEEHLTYAEDIAMERFGMFSDGLDDAMARIERFSQEG